MEKDRKLTALDAYFNTALAIPTAKMYFSLPGGFLTGRPIPWEKYISIILPDIKPKQEDTSDESLQKRFFHLEEALLVSGNNRNRFNVIVFDGLDASAWGFYDPDSSHSDTEEASDF